MMNKIIDLHVHSTYSDGALSPSELIDLAKKNGLTALALTDHDTIGGVSEALIHARRKDIDVVSGIELSAIHDNIAMHILGYGIDPDSPGLLETLQDVQLNRRERNHRIIENLNALGKKISLSEMDREQGRQTGRPHMAKLLVQKGYAKNIDDAFRRYLKDGASAYVEGRRLSAFEAIETINRAGGLAVLAHPAHIKKPLSVLPELLDTLTQNGLAGLEVFYPAHTKNIIKKLRKMGAQLGLLFSGGSDFHGINSHGDQLGGAQKTSRLPYDSWLEFKKHLAIRQNKYNENQVIK